MRTPQRISAPDPVRAIGNGLQPSLARVRALAERDLPVLIVGPTGVGKELLARAYAETWCQCRELNPDSRFAILNCTGFADELLRSELFGYVKGAFTGANQDHDGLIGCHDLICLDEIGDAGKQLQAQLLRVVESGEYLPVGKQRVQKCGVRFIASTNRLDGVRDDLVHRFHLVAVPQLALRGEDITAIVMACAAEKGVKAVTERFISWAARYTWPGNVRELLRHIEEAALTGLLDILFDVPVADPESYWRSLRRLSEEQRSDTTSLPISEFPNRFKGIYSTETMRWMIVQAEEDALQTNRPEKDSLRGIESSLREIAEYAKYKRVTDPSTTIGRRLRDRSAEPSWMKRPGHVELTPAEIEKKRLERALFEAGSVSALARREGLTEGGMRYRLQQHGIDPKRVLPVRTGSRKSAASRSG